MRASNFFESLAKDKKVLLGRFGKMACSERRTDTGRCELRAHAIVAKPFAMLCVPKRNPFVLASFHDRATLSPD
jgi:hypothetical protein